MNKYDEAVREMIFVVATLCGFLLLAVVGLIVLVANI